MVKKKKKDGETKRGKEQKCVLETELIELLRNLHSSNTVINNGKELLFSIFHMRILVSEEATDIK